jgi:hypothetical protein
VRGDVDAKEEEPVASMDSVHGGEVGPAQPGRWFARVGPGDRAVWAGSTGPALSSGTEREGQGMRVALERAMIV